MRKLIINNESDARDFQNFCCYIYREVNNGAYSAFGCRGKFNKYSEYMCLLNYVFCCYTAQWRFQKYTKNIDVWRRFSAWAVFQSTPGKFMHLDLRIRTLNKLYVEYNIEGSKGGLLLRAIDETYGNTIASNP
jgi:hypothetical protein